MKREATPEEIRYLRQAALLLELPTSAWATGTVLFHRYCAYINSLKSPSDPFPPQLGMMLCIYLATKVTEEPRKQRDIINVGYRLANRDSEILPVTDKVFLGLRASMAEGELAMMRILGFDLSVELPHVWAADILNGMAWWASDNGRPPDDTELVDPRMKRVAAEAWLMANAAVEHGLVDREPARILGAACVAIAIDRCGEALPARSLDEWADIWARTSARRLQAVKELLLSQVEAEKMRG